MRSPAENTLAELAALVAGAGSVGERADAACQVLADAMGFERAWLVRKDGNVLRTLGGLAMVLADPRHPPLPIDVGVVGRCARERVTLRIDDVMTSPDYHAATALTRSELAVPILDGDEVLGVINCEANRLAAFGPEEQSLVERAAPLLARLIRAAD
jgi:putative methionine-R-sulfoxide reductase with GAF domain